MSRKINRRDFIKKSSTAICGVGLAASSETVLAKQPKGKSKIVEITHPGVVSGNRKIDKAIVKKMLQKGMRAFTKSKRPWSQFIKPGDRVGLKINTLGRPLLFTHHELIQAVIDELKDLGVKENNIIVWDRFEPHMLDSKFKINTSTKGVRYYGSENETDNNLRYDLKKPYTSKSDNPERRDKKNGYDSPFSAIFTKDCDKIINMAILKDHVLAGVTLCLKNLAYGITNNNARFHGRKHIGPFIADICDYPEVKKKTVLHIIDGLEACYENGPVPRNPNVLFTPKTLWIGTDPVSLDAVASKVIEAKRKEKGLRSLEEERRPADHIELAAKKGIGISDTNRIKIERINLTG
ncbi:MAG: DUF362 domain-containing protein [Proteobacteria bacterium]|nr:DUF362 domain-containing protein [Pseudomonadota bacterium]